MADVFDFYVYDNRRIVYEIAEPIMQEDNKVTDFQFHIPKVLNGLDVSSWAWWFVYVNARGEKHTEPIVLSDDPERPLEYNVATYSVDYGMSIKAGAVKFALEAINAEPGGNIINEWHTYTYQTIVKETLQGNQVDYDESQSDIISALITQIQNKYNQLVGGATPLPVNLKSLMTDHDKVYLYTGSETGESTGYWYHWNGTDFVPGGLYGAGVQIDPVPTQGSANAVSSGGVYSALASIPSTSVKNAIYNLLSKSAYAVTTDVADNLAVLLAWTQEVTSLTLNKSSITLSSAGATEQITATVIPSGSTVTWASSDTSVATVDGTGLVTAVATGTAIITATSGNLTRACTVTASWEIPDTTAQIAQENVRFVDVTTTHRLEAVEHGGITIVYDMDTPTTTLYPAGVIVNDEIITSNSYGTLRIYKDGEYVNYWGMYERWAMPPAESYTEFKRSTTVSEYNQIAFTVDMRYLDDSYMYDYTTGQVWFAGINTPYYGMSNISEAA